MKIRIMFNFYLFLWIYFLSVFIGDVNLKEQLNTADTRVVALGTVEGSRSNAERRTVLGRHKRQIANGLGDRYLLPSLTCTTRAGILGKCLTFDQCYPQFDVSPSYYPFFDSMPDACHLTKSSEEEYGVCCGNSKYDYISNYMYMYVTETFSKPSITYWPPTIRTRGPAPSAATHSIPTRPPTYAPASRATHRPSTMWTKRTTKPTHWTTQRPQSTSEAGSQRPTATKPPFHPTKVTTTPRPSTTAKPINTYPATPKPTTATTTMKTTTTTPYMTRPATTRPTFTYPTTTTDNVNQSFGQNTACGISNSRHDQERIVGGQDSELNEWPWMAGILAHGRLFCGGSLIDNEHILTAAHCIAHMNTWQVAALRVYLGDYNIKSQSDTHHLERKVKFVIRHREFNPHTLYNDIALLKLDSPIQFNKNVKPVCLPQGRSAYFGNMATVVGWGSLREMGPAAGILQEVNIPIWSNSDCSSKYGLAAPGGIIDTFLCAGKDRKDSCSGDSGGPLMISEGNQWVQIGIVSWGIGCGKGQYPGVYTRLTSFMPWVHNNLKY